MLIDTDSQISRADLGELLGITTRAVGLIEEKAVCRRDMPAGEWLRTYVERLREQAAGRIPGDGDIDLVTERALLARRQRERIELDMRVRGGELVEVQDVLTTWAGHIGNAKQALLGLPAKAAGLVAPADKRAQAEAILRKLIKEILTDLSTADGRPRGSQPGASARQQQGVE